MTLKEFFEQNGNKPIEIREDGTIRILEEKGPWKPEYGERYYAISDDGKRRAYQWSHENADKFRLWMGNVFQTETEAKRALNRLRARKKFLDAGGHEGMDGLVFVDRYNAYPQRCDKTLIVAKEGSVTAFDIWFETEADCNRAIDSLTKDEVAALCWTGDEE